VDAGEMRAQALEQASHGALTTAAPLTSAAFALAYLDDAVEADDYATADRLRKAAQAALLTIRNKAQSNPFLEAAVRGRANDIEALRKAYEPLQDAAKTLATNPDD